MTTSTKTSTSDLRYTTYGSVRGMGPLRDDADDADQDLRRDAAGCRMQGGYSDRGVCYVDRDGWLYHDPGCQDWVAGPGGPSCGGVRHPDA